MTPRERILSVLAGEKPDQIPCYYECAMDATVLRDLLPPDRGDPVENEIALSRYFDNSACSIPCGRGMWLSTTDIKSAADEYLYRFETGAVWRESYKPVFCREALDMPVKEPEDAFSFRMPEADAPGRIDAASVRRQAEAFHEAGYFVEAGVMGAWYGTYYYLARFEDMLMWMAAEPEAADVLFQKIARFSLDCAAILLNCGVDCIATASDLGSGTGLLFSRAMFRRYVLPWLEELSALCHEKGAYLHLHSHGHIQELMDDIVSAGVDIINPIGPSDHNDMKLFKEKWGDRITLHGGIGTGIAQMTPDAMRAHIESVVNAGRVGGRYFPRTESGVPYMPEKSIRSYIEILREVRARGYL